MRKVRVIGLGVHAESREGPVKPFGSLHAAARVVRKTLRTARFSWHREVMPIVVQKYGGSSVADVAKLKAVAERVMRTRRGGHDVVVVVSAMGDIDR